MFRLCPTVHPSLWALAFLAAGWGPLVAMKPTLAPFALLGIYRRTWWKTAGLALLLALPLGALWLDYVTSIRNADNGYGLVYLLGEWPIAIALMLTTMPVRHWRDRWRETREPNLVF